MSIKSSEYKKLRERRTIASTIGYCFVIVLVVLFVMSSMLTDTYTVALESERAESMESLAVATSTVLGHTNISEGMTFPLDIPSYARDKNYIYDIYLKAGNSFMRIYTSSGVDNGEQFYLSGVGEEYNDCFELQETAFTSRNEDGVKYVCSIAPIISSENTVAGILEIRMPYSDFTSTVNGMSLSWIFTIFSIAVSMGILIFEINLLVTTVSKGITGNVPTLIMYGDGAVRFLSFFVAFGSIMPPIIVAEFIKKDLYSAGSIVIHLLIALGLILYSIGFFAFLGLRKTLKFKLTGKISLIISIALGYFLSLISGIADNSVVMLILLLPIAFFYGMAFDSLRDFRINAGKLGYEGFDDRTVHNIQSTGYFLGIAVGTVVSGICFERFGLLIVNIIAGFAMLLSVFGILHFMHDNIPVRENYLPVNKFLEILTDKYIGRFLLSTYFVLGVIFSFLIGFVPNYLQTVGISLATSSFYFFVTIFTSSVVCMIIKDKYNDVLTSKIRVLISSLTSLLGLLIFALMPTAKILVVCVALLGFSIGIHDYYYLYVLFLLSKNRIKTNLRKIAELAFLMGVVVALPVFALAFIVDLRIVLVVTLILFFIIAFIYPFSRYADEVDDVKLNVKKSKKSKKKVDNVNTSVASDINVQNTETVSAPTVDLYAVPEGYEQAVSNYQNSIADADLSQSDYSQYYDNQLYDDIYQNPNNYPMNNNYGGNPDGYVE